MKKGVYNNNIVVINYVQRSPTIASATRVFRLWRAKGCHAAPFGHDCDRGHRCACLGGAGCTVLEETGAQALKLDV